MLDVDGWVECDLTYWVFNAGNGGGVFLHSAPSLGFYLTKCLLRYTKVGHTVRVASTMVSATP